MDRRLAGLYDGYTRRPLPRRLHLERLGKLAGSVAAPVLLECDDARAGIVAGGDARIETRALEAGGGKVGGHAAYPTGKMPETAGHVVIVIHENRGLDPHFEDMARHRRRLQDAQPGEQGRTTMPAPGATTKRRPSWPGAARPPFSGRSSACDAKSR